MNIKELFNKLFKLGTKNYGLALPTDLVSVPMRDRLSDDKIKELDEFKDNYLRTLEQKKHFTSHDISSKDFNQEMLMNFELFGRLVINHDSDYNLDMMDYYQKVSLWFKQRINPRKIKQYIAKMEAMFNETHLRLVALKEIYSESGKRLSRDKQNAILNEIYNLTSKYIIFKNNVYAALTEVETYKKEINDRNNIQDDDVPEHMLINREKELLHYLVVLMPDKLYEIDEMKLDIFDRMAYLERELEIYTYKNLKINDLNQKLDEIDKIEKTPENRQMLLDKINALEIKYLALNDYGEHELDLKPLYEVKFDILTIDVIHQKNSPFGDRITNGRGQKYYEDIILDRLTTNITGVDSLLSQRLGDDKEVIPAIIRMLKYDNSYFDYGEILRDKFKLSLILSMESDDKARYFFNNYMLDLSSQDRNHFGSYHVGLLFNFFGKPFRESIVPFGTLCRIYSLLINDPTYMNIEHKDYVLIYEHFFKNIDTDKFKIPEGITASRIYIDDYVVNANIAKRIDGKTVVMPSNLEYLDVGELSSYLSGKTIPKIVLNEGLEEIKGDLDFVSLKTESITIPSTLLNIHQTDSFFPNRSILKNAHEFIFTNYEASNILNDERSRKYILRELCKQAFSNFRVMTDPHIYIHEINNNSRNIILESSDGTRHTISIYEIVRENLLKEIYDTGQYSTEGKIVVIDQGGTIKESINKIDSEIVSLLSTKNKKR